MNDCEAAKNFNIKKQLYKLAIARCDIFTALELCTLCNSMKNDKRRKISKKTAYQDSLIASMITAYSRPFSDNQPYGPLQKKWSTFENPLHNNLHEKIIEFRNKKIAHTDFDTRQVYFYTTGYCDEYLIGGLTITTRLFPSEDIPIVIDMCNILRERFKAHINLLAKYLLEVIPPSPLQPVELFSEIPLDKILDKNK